MENVTVQLFRSASASFSIGNNSYGATAFSQVTNNSAGTIPSISVMGGQTYRSSAIEKILDIVGDMDVEKQKVEQEEQRKSEHAATYGRFREGISDFHKVGFLTSAQTATDVRNNKDPDSIVTVSARVGHAGFDLTVGSEGDDTLIYTNSSSDTINSKVYGGGGDDVITMTSTANGPHTALGGDGNDTISVSAMVANARGGDGDDVIAVAGRSAHAGGGKGNDMITVSGGSVSASGNDGDDTIIIDGSFMGPVLGGNGDDVIIASGDHIGLIRGNRGNDTITVNGGNVGRVDGGRGDDVITVTSDNDFDDWSNHDHEFGYGRGSQGYDNPATIDGGQGNDVININGNARVIHRAGDGQDVINVTDTTEIVTFGDDWFDDVLLLDEATFSYADGELTVTFEGRDDKMTIRAAEGELSWELTSDRTFMITVTKAAETPVDTEASVDVEVEQDDQAD